MARKQNQDSRTGRDPQANQNAGGSGATAESRGKLEWTVSIVSAVLILAVLGYLGWQGFSARKPPSFQTAVDSIWTAAGRHYVSAAILNTGDRSAEHVLIGFELVRADSTVAETEVALDWLPAHSKREVIALFEQDPRGRPILVEVRGYLVP